MRVVTASAFAAAIAIAFAVTARGQDAPAAPVTNARGVPGWPYPVAAAVPAAKDDATVFHPAMPDLVGKGRIAEGVRASGVRRTPEPPCGRHSKGRDRC